MDRSSSFTEQRLQRLNIWTKRLYRHGIARYNEAMPSTIGSTTQANIPIAQARAGEFVASTGTKSCVAWSATGNTSCHTNENQVDRDCDLTAIAGKFHSNQQYSVTAITNSSAGIVERYAYQAYGEPTILDASASVLGSSSIGNRYTYTGREWDGTVALYHFRARWMSGLTGRFLSRDPTKYKGSPYDLYEFCDSSSLHKFDPFGLQGVPGRMYCCGKKMIYVGQGSTQGCCSDIVYNTYTQCCEAKKIVDKVSIWRCVVDNPAARCLDYIPGTLTCPFGWRFRHSYVCMDGPNQDCYAAYSDGFWGPYDPENAVEGGPGQCNEVKVCPGEKERYETPMMPWPHNWLSQNCHQQSGNWGPGCTWFW